MTKYARLVSGVAVDVVDQDPATLFVAEVAAQFIQAPNSVVVGSRKSGSQWSEPLPAPAPSSPARRLQLTPSEFKMLLLPSERRLIRAARAYTGTDAVPLEVKAILDDWYDILDDPRLTTVDLTLQQTIDAINFLATVGLVEAGRPSEILDGVPE